MFWMSLTLGIILSTRGNHSDFIWTWCDFKKLIKFKITYLFYFSIIEHIHPDENKCRFLLWFGFRVHWPMSGCFEWFGLWCLTPLSTILQLYRGGQIKSEWFPRVDRIIPSVKDIQNIYTCSGHSLHGHIRLYDNTWDMSYLPKSSGILWY
jgi:hypothetical protein